MAKVAKRLRFSDKKFCAAVRAAIFLKVGEELGNGSLRLENVEVGVVGCGDFLWMKVTRPDGLKRHAIDAFMPEVRRIAELQHRDGVEDTTVADVVGKFFRETTWCLNPVIDARAPDRSYLRK